MTATPIVPGRAYRVTYQGQAHIVLAPHPCAALILAARLLIGGVACA